MVFAIASEIERELISKQTKESLDANKLSRIKLDRPVPVKVNSINSGLRSKPCFWTARARSASQTVNGSQRRHYPIVSVPNNNRWAILSRKMQPEINSAPKVIYICFYISMSNRHPNACMVVRKEFNYILSPKPILKVPKRFGLSGESLSKFRPIAPKMSTYTRLKMDCWYPIESPGPKCCLDW